MLAETYQPYYLPTLLLSPKADTHFAVPRRVEGWVDLSPSLPTSLFSSPSYHSLSPSLLFPLVQLRESGSASSGSRIAKKQFLSDFFSLKWSTWQQLFCLNWFLPVSVNVMFLHHHVHYCMLHGNITADEYLTWMKLFLVFIQHK